jgi:flagellum-specific peptidoglycan hydrolase FlgJ
MSVPCPLAPSIPARARTGSLASWGSTLLGLGLGVLLTLDLFGRPASAETTSPGGPVASAAERVTPVGEAQPQTAPAPDETRASAESREEQAVVEINPPVAVAADTPLEESEAAAHLARAWHTVQHAKAKPATLALLWAHWAHETARGRRMHAYNFAGLKGRGPSGASVVIWTREGPRPSALVKRTFRAYSTPEEGARDYVELLASRYPSALRAARRGDVTAFANALDMGGYFTGDSSEYLRALTSLSLEFRRRGLARQPVP